MSRDRAAIHRLVDALPDEELPALARLLEMFREAGGLAPLLDQERVRDALDRDDRFGDDVQAEAASLSHVKRPWRTRGAP